MGRAPGRSPAGGKDRDRREGGGFDHSPVVGDDPLEVGSQLERSGQVDSVERPEPGRGQPARLAERRRYGQNQGHDSQGGAHGLCGDPDPPSHAEGFGLEEVRGDQRPPHPGPFPQSGRLLFCDHELEERRGVEIPGQRQSSRRCSSSAAAVLIAAGRRAGRSPTVRIDGCTRPASMSPWRPALGVGGERTATNWPRSVTPSVSPSRTRRSAADACCCNSLTPMVSMCVKCSTAISPAESQRPRLTARRVSPLPPPRGLSPERR
jgi:hypothetical protein